MGKRIIISTDHGKLFDVIGNNNTQKQLLLLQNNKFIGYDYTTNEFAANKFDTDIILIQHSATKDELRNIAFKKETDYFLHHTNTNALSSVQMTLFFGIIDGKHETPPEYKYKPVFDIILDPKNNKAERIIEFLFPNADAILCKKLDLLHQCLMPVDAYGVVLKKDWWKEENDKKEAENNLNNLKTAAKKNNEPFNVEYMQALEKLKHALLQS